MAFSCLCQPVRQGENLKTILKASHSQILRKPGKKREQNDKALILKDKAYIGNKIKKKTNKKPSV